MHAEVQTDRCSCLICHDVYQRSHSKDCRRREIALTELLWGKRAAILREKLGTGFTRGRVYAGSMVDPLKSAKLGGSLRLGLTLGSPMVTLPTLGTPQHAFVPHLLAIVECVLHLAFVRQETVAANSFPQCL